MLLSHLRIFFTIFWIFISCQGCATLSQETVYLTWQQSPSTTMTIQWISFFQDKESFVSYRSTDANQEWKMATGQVIPFPQMPNYFVHRVELNNLKPNTEYVFKILAYPEEYRFLTAPVMLEKEIRFVVGGDIYHDELLSVAKTCQKAAQFNPLFALVGGDIAYAVKSPHIAVQAPQRWIDWIKVWHSYMISPQGHMIPTLAAIGNHDLIGHYDQTPEQALIFSTLFPMPGPTIYNVLDFESYLSIFILDSGHANPVAGKQSNWLKAQLDKRQNVPHRFALYHVPAYPSVRNYGNKYSAAIRKSWVPIFEEGGIHAAFEHHDHAYKRTHPLLKNRMHPLGIVYIGDGGWGVDKARKMKGKRPYIAKFAPARHFVAVTITPSQQIFNCITDEGKTIDHYSQSLRHLKISELMTRPKN